MEGWVGVPPLSWGLSACPGRPNPLQERLVTPVVSLRSDPKSNPRAVYFLLSTPLSLLFSFFVSERPTRVSSLSEFAHLSVTFLRLLLFFSLPPAKVPKSWAAVVCWSGAVPPRPLPVVPSRPRPALTQAFAGRAPRDDLVEGLRTPWKVFAERGEGKPSRRGPVGWWRTVAARGLRRYMTCP